MGTLSAVKSRLIELCAKKEMSFNALANISGVHPSTVKGIMNGASQNPGIVTLKKLCHGLEMTLTEFFAADIFENLEQEIK